MNDPLADILDDPLADVLGEKVTDSHKPIWEHKFTPAVQDATDVPITPLKSDKPEIMSANIPKQGWQYLQDFKNTAYGLAGGLTMGAFGEPPSQAAPSGIPMKPEKSEGILPTTPYDVGQTVGSFAPISKAMNIGRGLVGAAGKGILKKSAGEAVGGATYESVKHYLETGEISPGAAVSGAGLYGGIGLGGRLGWQYAAKPALQVGVRAVKKVGEKVGEKLSILGDPVLHMWDNLQNLGRLSGLGEKARDQVMNRQANVVKAQEDLRQFINRSARGLRDREKEDMMFFVEKTGNPRYFADTYDILKQRMSPKAIYEARNIRMKLYDLRRQVNASGYSKDVGFIRDYVTHFWRGTRKQVDDVVETFRKNNPFAEARNINTYELGIQQGLKPRFNDIYDVLAEYNRISQQTIANNAMVGALKNIRFSALKEWSKVLPSGKRANLVYEDYSKKSLPIIMRQDRKSVPSTYMRLQSPALARSINSMGDIVMVHPDVYKPLKTVFSTPFTGRVVNAIQTINAIAKKAKLSVSFFHHLALTESALYSGILPTSYKKGLRLLDNKAFRDEMIDAGLDVGSPSDVQRGIVNGFLRNMAMSRNKAIRVPGIAIQKVNEKWDRALWDHYHRGLKAYAFYAQLERSLKAFPKLDVKQVKKDVADHVNDAFGGQNWDSLMWNAKTRQLAHWAFLAPDWTISNIKIATSAFRTKRGGVSGQVQGHLARRYWARAAFWFTLGTNMANYAMTGHFAWDNEPGHEFDVDIGEGEDGRHRYVIASKQVREPLRWITNPIYESGVKASPLVQMGAEQYTGKSMTGWPTGISTRKEDFWDAENMGERAKTLAGHFVPFAFSGSNLLMSLPVRKGKKKTEDEALKRALLESSMSKEK